MTDVMIRDIARFVCDRECVTMRELMSRSRSARVAHARQLICWLAARHTGRNIDAIAAVLERDRVTVVQSIETVARRVAEVRRIYALDAALTERALAERSTLYASKPEQKDVAHDATQEARSS